MKKPLLLLGLFLSFIPFIQAQEISKNALGLRLGAADGFGTEISYQYRLGDANRLEFDLGWHNGAGFDGFKLSGLYQWVWNKEGGFNWYAGVGAGLGAYDFSDDAIDEDTFFYLPASLGIEYNFDIPLLISLDVRPEFGLTSFRDDLVFDIGLGAKYQF